MSQALPAIVPVRPNLKHKTDVLNHDRIPDSRCEMEFRPPSQSWERANYSVLPLLFVAPLMGLLWSALFGHDLGFRALIFLGTTFVLFILPCILIVMGLAAFFPNRIRETIKSQGWKAILRRYVAMPLLIWLMALLTLMTKWEIGAVAFLSTLVCWYCWRSIDRFATHALYWMSANPKIDHRTLVKWRSDWQLRSNGFSQPQPRRIDLSPADLAEFEQWLDLRLIFRFSSWWLWLCWSAPVLIVAAGNLAQGELRGFVVGLAIWACLIIWGTVQAARFPGSLRIFWKALSGWVSFDRPVIMPPWVFDTPVGDSCTRKWDALSAIALITAALPMSVAWGGSSSTGFSLSLFGAVTIPSAVFLLSSYCVTAPLLSAWYHLLEAPDALEHLPDETDFDGYVRRIQQSHNPLERNCLFLGFNVAHEYPVLLDGDLTFEHYHMVGPTGIGKTALGLVTLVTQLILRGDGPVVIVDGKGDPAFFHTVLLLAKKVRRIVKWFTNLPNHSTYVFNPFAQSHLDRLTLHQIVGLFVQSLNLHHGDDYGRAWFSSAARNLLKQAVASTLPDQRRFKKRPGKTSPPKFPRIESFGDLNDIISFLAKDGDEFEAAQHLSLMIETLSEYEQMNFSPKQMPQHPAVRNAIHMPEVIQERQIIYFYLAGAIDLASVGEMGRLALFSLLSAAMAHREIHGQIPRCYFIADEAQVLIAQNIANVLAQARSHGVACVLAHQTMAQLKPPGGVDLRELVLNCTSVKQFFAARDPVTQKYLMDISGQTLYYNQSWMQSASTVIDGAVSLANAASRDAMTEPLVTISETVGPRLSAQDIQDVNHDPNQSIFSIERASGLSQYQGPFPMRTDWPLTRQEFVRRRDKLSWPTSSDAITVTPMWPAGNEHTIVAKTNPADVSRKLHEIRRTIQGD